MKRFLRFFYWAVGGVGVVFFLAWAGFFVWAQMEERRDETAVRQWIAERDAIAADDIYGGETQEETFALFLDALRDGDFDLASRYFLIAQQPVWRASFTRIASAGLLDDMIADLENMENEGTIDARHFAHIDNRWKIVSL